LSHLELDWLTEGTRYLRRQGAAVWVVAEAYEKSERERRLLFRKVKSDLALYQRREGLRRVLNLEVLESVPSVHTNIIATMPNCDALDRTIERLYNAAYGSGVYAQAVTDWNGLTTYLAGEATPQAWHKAGRSFPRIKGSHPLGAGGGDRVRVSKDLEAALLRSGRVEPRRRTYAARSLPVAPEPAPQPKPAPIRLVASMETQPSLFEDLPKRSYLEPAEVRTFREETGCTQAEVSGWIGVKNRSHVANYERGHDRLSRQRQRALRHFMETRRLAA
jgi:DNA-binding transcriptional regulator YiaG